MKVKKKNSYVVALDPGSEETAWILLREGTCEVLAHGKEDNETVLARLTGGQLINVWGPAPARVLAIEMIASYGMPVGKDVFETCVWIGRFRERWGRYNVRFVYRREVKLHLCGDQRAKDGNVRQALIDRYGGSRRVAVGTKGAPGPLYGIKADEWQALGVALVASETTTVVGEPRP